jgi:hypothetical protein
LVCEGAGDCGQQTRQPCKEWSEVIAGGGERGVDCVSRRMGEVISAHAMVGFEMTDRRRACERELAVNKADAPDLYLGVVPISRDGFNLKFGHGSTIVELAVHLRRFDENRMLDLLVKRNELNLEIIAKLAGVVSASHRRAPIISNANEHRL